MGTQLFKHDQADLVLKDKVTGLPLLTLALPAETARDAVEARATWLESEHKRLRRNLKGKLPGND